MADKKKPNPGEGDPPKDPSEDPSENNASIDAATLKAVFESKEFGDALSRVVHQALTNRFEREGLKGLGKTVQELQAQVKETTVDEEKLVERLLGKLDEKQAELQGGKKKEKDRDPKEDPAVLELRKQLETTNKTLEKIKAEAEEKDRIAQEERRKGNQLRARTLVKETLAGKVLPEAVESVTDLFFGRNLVKVQDDGSVSIQLEVVDKITGREQREFTVEDGVAHYLASSPEAKLFQPPKQDPGGGSGNKPPPKFAPSPGIPPRPPNGAQPQSPEETQVALLAALDQIQKNQGAK
jgi:hypothetical protein